MNRRDFLGACLTAPIAARMPKGSFVNGSIIGISGVGTIGAKVFGATVGIGGEALIVDKWPTPDIIGQKVNNEMKAGTNDNRNNGHRHVFPRLDDVNARVNGGRTVIAFAGRAGSGKSTAANHLIAAHNFCRIKWAAGLKEMLRAYLRHRGVSPDHIEDMLEGKQKETASNYLNGRTPRYAMQKLGDEWGRKEIHPDLWVDTEVDALPAVGCFVSDDTRYPNEVAAIHKLGGMVVRIVRPDHVGLTGAAGAHASETHELPADVMLMNDGSIADLLAKVDHLIIGRLATAAVA